MSDKQNGDKEQSPTFRKQFGVRAWAFLILALTAILLFLIVNIPAIKDFFLKLGQHTAPLIIGAVIAYLCDPILQFYEFRLFRRIRSNGFRRGISLALTMITAVAALVLIIMMMAPQLVRSIKDLVLDYETYLNDMLRFVQNLLDKLTANLPIHINISSKEHLVEFLTKMFGSVEDFYDTEIKPIIAQIDAGKTAWNAVGGLFTYLKNFLLGLFIAFYILASKEKRIGQLKSSVVPCLSRRQTERLLPSLHSLISPLAVSYMES